MRTEEKKQGCAIKLSFIFEEKKKKIKQFAYHLQGQLLMIAFTLSHG